MSYLLLTWLLAPLWWPIALLRRRFAPTPRRILLLEIAGIGDVVCSTAVFRVLRAHFPQAHIELLVEPFAADIVAGDPSVDGVIAWSSKTLRGLRGRLALTRRIAGFDTAICLNPGAAQLVAVCLAATPRRLSVLPDTPKMSYRLLRPLLTASSAHARGQVFVQTQLNLLRAFGIVSDDRRKSLRLPDAARHKVAALLPSRPLIGIAIGSGLKLKEIPEAVLRGVIGGLLAGGRNGVVLIGGEKERDKGARLLADFPGAPVVDLTGRLSLSESAAAIERLSLFIGVDSALTHIADALDVPIVCLGGPSDPVEQVPTGTHVRMLRRSPPCMPCSRVFLTPRDCLIGTRECVTGVTADEIIAASAALCPSVEAEPQRPSAHVGERT